MKETIEKNGIKLNFHKFLLGNSKNPPVEEILFTCINNREKDLEKSGISQLYSTLSQYDDVEHSVSTNLKHKLVYEQISKISNKKIVNPSKNERRHSKSFKSSLNKKGKSSFSSHDDEVPKILFKRKVTAQPEEDEEIIIEVDDLLDYLSSFNSVSKREELENVLEDLHKLGLIVYLKTKLLSNIVIPNPQCFNNVEYIFFFLIFIFYFFLFFNFYFFLLILFFLFFLFLIIFRFTKQCLIWARKRYKVFLTMFSSN